MISDSKLIDLFSPLRFDRYKLRHHLNPGLKTIKPSKERFNSAMDLEAIRKLYGIPKECHDSVCQKMDSETRDLAMPKDVSDTYRTPKTKYGYRLHEDEYLPSTGCTCSISDDCQHKPEGQLDCRSLAPEPKEPGIRTGIQSG